MEPTELWEVGEEGRQEGSGALGLGIKPLPPFEHISHKPVDLDQHQGTLRGGGKRKGGREGALGLGIKHSFTT